MIDCIRKFWGWIGPFIVLAGIWELAGQLSDPLFLPPLSTVLSGLGEALGDGGGDDARGCHYAQDDAKLFVWQRFRGAVRTNHRLVRRVAEAFFAPLIRFTYSLPRVALIPLFILWLGIGEQTIVTAASIAVFYLVLINTIAGVKDTDPLLIRAAQNLGANSRQILLRVFLPTSMESSFPVSVCASVKLSSLWFLVRYSSAALAWDTGSGRLATALNTTLVFIILIFLAVLGYAVIKSARVC